MALLYGILHLAMLIELEYLLRLGVKAGFSPLPGGRQHCVNPYGM